MPATAEPSVHRAIGHEEGESLRYDVFVSYSHLDVEFAKKLRATLTEHGKDVWMDESNIPAAARWTSVLTRALEGSGRGSRRRRRPICLAKAGCRLASAFSA